MNIYLIAGHHERDTGATALHKDTGTIKENELTKELRYLVKSYLQHDNIIIDDDKATLSDVINEVNKKIKPNDLLIDIHFNSFHVASATGVEVILPTMYNTVEKDIGNSLCRSLSDIMEIANRGIKTPKDTARGSIGILKGKGNRILLEVCFISNLKDIIAYVKHKHLIALIIAETLDNYAESTIMD